MEKLKTRKKFRKRIPETRPKIPANPRIHMAKKRHFTMGILQEIVPLASFSKSINGLSIMARENMKEYPFIGHCYVFCNRAKTMNHTGIFLNDYQPVKGMMRSGLLCIIELVLKLLKISGEGIIKRLLIVSGFVLKLMAGFMIVMSKGIMIN